MTMHIPNIASAIQNEAPHSAPLPRTGPYRKFFKRVFDVTLVLLSVPFVLPLIALLALAIALTGNRPFYSQLRLGKDGKPFRMWKLRTMVSNADAQLETHLQQNPQARQEWDSTQKLKDDPRITPFGHVLRKTSIDELPQLFNVLAGSLSLVGPRPHAVNAHTDNKTWDDVVDGYFARHKVKPGVTGWAQINGWRGEVDTPEKIQNRVECDVYYIENWSILFDLKILFLTPFRLLNTENAY